MMYSKADIEMAFMTSWDWVEEIYEPIKDRWNEDIMAFIQAFRLKDYDRHLRAGTALYSLVVSRSLGHGLRGGQPHITFDLFSQEMIVIPRLNGVNHRFETSRFEISDEIESLLKQLVAYPID